MQEMCCRSLDLKFKAKLKLRVWKAKNPLWPPGSHFESDISEKSIGFFPHTLVMCYWSLGLIFKAKQKLESGWEKSKMATWRPFWKWHIWKSICLFPYTLVMCYWSLDLIFKAKQKLESGNRKIQDGHEAAILKVISLKINRLLPMATNNVHMKLQIEIPKQTWVTLRKPCRLQTDGRTDRQTDRQTDSQTDRQTDRRTRWFQYTPPPTSLGGGYNVG